MVSFTPIGPGEKARSQTNVNDVWAADSCEAWIVQTLHELRDRLLTDDAHCKFHLDFHISFSVFLLSIG